MLYSNKSLHTRSFWVINVDATQTLFIFGSEYSSLNEGQLRFELTCDILLC